MADNVDKESDADSSLEEKEKCAYETLTGEIYKDLECYRFDFIFLRIFLLCSATAFMAAFFILSIHVDNRFKELLQLLDEMYEEKIPVVSKCMPETIYIMPSQGPSNMWAWDEQAKTLKVNTTLFVH